MKPLKSRVVEYLLLVFGVVIVGYVVVYPLLGNVSYLLKAYYGAALMVALLFGWMEFFAVPFMVRLVRKCRGCGSKNIHWQEGKFVCKDCNNVFSLDIHRDAKRAILVATPPLLLLFVPFVLAHILVGEAISKDVIIGGVFISCLLWSGFSLLVILLKFIDIERSAYFSKHKMLGLTLLVVLLLALFILTAVVLATIIPTVLG